MAYYKVEISAENKEQADFILNELLALKHVTGGQFIASPARFLWKGDVVDMDFITITSFTNERHKESILEIVQKISKEEVPMVVFLPFEGNKKLLTWIDQTLS